MASVETLRLVFEYVLDRLSNNMVVQNLLITLSERFD